MIENIENTLHDIGKLYKTDKFAHQFKGISYLHIYDLYFRTIKEKEISILELGVKRGSSLRMWETYFPKSYIYGLDINPKCKQYENERIKIEIGCQTNKKVLNKLLQKEKSFDIILDDCSHIQKLTIESFKYLWQYVKPGGYYIIEDLKSLYGLKTNKKGVEIFFNIINSIDHIKGDMMFIHFWSMICIIRKV